MSDRSAEVVESFYGLSAVAEQVGDGDVARWLAALVLLLSQEISVDRFMTLSQEAADAVHSTESESK